MQGKGTKTWKAMGAAGKTVRRFWTEHEDTKHGNQTNFLARKAMMQQHITHDNVLGIPDDPVALEILGVYHE